MIWCASSICWYDCFHFEAIWFWAAAIGHKPHGGFLGFSWGLKVAMYLCSFVLLFVGDCCGAPGRVGEALEVISHNFREDVG